MNHLARLTHKFQIAVKAVAQLGTQPVALNLLYQTAVKSGFYRLGHPERLPDLGALRFHSPLTLPDAHQLIESRWADEQLQANADRICGGEAQIFGAQWVALDFSHTDPLKHWSLTHPPAHDIKFDWEPARFDWVYTLARAYTRTDNDAYAQAFWQQFESFSASNPPYLGPHWLSGQEAALRLLALCFARQAFHSAPSSTPDRVQQLAQAAALHARRILPTLIYARSQQNNHLISEALGLYAAGICLPDFPEAAHWRKTGWRWLNTAFQSQIASDGTYTQHSTNYHRLMLTLALWADAYARASGGSLPAQTRERLAAATKWLAAQMDPRSGRVPNLGSNDGAWLSPLAAGDFQDYRPVVQTACRAFLDQPCLPPGTWDEFSLWLGLPLTSEHFLQPSSPAVHQLDSFSSSASLRAVRYSSRPAHADQLHVDLWWQGENIALDPGTFQYNEAPPWQNGLASTAVHNTLQIERQDQMLRAGKFLWLDWAQARLLPSRQPGQLQAEHDGYRRFGLVHRRTLCLTGVDCWQIIDDVLPMRSGHKTHSVRLHWLLPDWDYHFAGSELTLSGAPGSIRLEILASQEAQPLTARFSLIRAGQTLVGQETNPTLGWYSPTYGVRIPALSFVAEVDASAPLQLLSNWRLTGEPSKSSIR